jgi:hypothetical protein
MRNKVIAIIAAIGISFAVATPANAQFWGYGGYYPGFGYGGWGYGGYGYGLGMMGAGLAVGALAGAAIAASNQPYYGGYYDGYAAPQVNQRKQIIIRNSPGARVIEQDIFDW